jgi:hypothetical protein
MQLDRREGSLQLLSDLILDAHGRELKEVGGF